MKKDELLEKQLEKLFSDIVVPEPTPRFDLRPTSAAAEAALQLEAPPLVRAPKPVGRERLPQFKGVTRALGALAAFVVLSFVLVNQGGLARPARTAAPPAAIDGAVAYSAPLSATLATPLAPLPTSAAVFQSPTATRTRALPSPTPAATRAREAAPTLTLEPTPTPTPTLELAPISPTPDGVEPEPTLEPPATPPPPAPTDASPTRLVIPAINLTAPVVTVGLQNYEINGQLATTWAVPDRFAAGWHHTSAPPGQAGNTVLNGHQDVYGEVFRDLATLQAGDEVIVYAGTSAHRYRVSEWHILEEEGQPPEVRAANVRWIMPTADERLTLVTCWPYAKNTHRLIVVALPVTP